MSVPDRILADLQADLAERESEHPLDEVKESARLVPSALDPLPVFRAPGVSVMAEVKRATPGRGALAPVPDPAALARDYAAGGAAAISVVTEHRLFGGSRQDLREVRAAVDIPVLCNDLIISSYQLWEARAAGADLALLIAALLDRNALLGLVERAESIGLTPVVEVNTAQEVDRAVDAGAPVIGVNARGLSTLRVDRDVFPQLASLIPDGVVRVAESGVRGPHDVLEYARSGADVVLVGESLVTDKDPRSAVADMVAVGSHPALQQRH